MNFDFNTIISTVSVSVVGGLVTTFFLSRNNASKITKLEEWKEKKDALDNEQEKTLIKLDSKINSVEHLIATKIDALQSSFEAFAKTMSAKMEQYDKGIEEFWKNKPWEK